MSSNFVEVPATALSIIKRGLVHGVGINDAGYLIQIVKNRKIVGRCPYYTVWCSMLSRCYGGKYQEAHPTYNGCVVCKEWLLFSGFRTWMETQDWEGKELDKDIKIPGNKEYNVDTCVFVTGRLNRLLLDNPNRRGKWPVGVCFDKSINKFRAYCSNDGKQNHLGCFSNPEEASKAYAKFKIQIIESYIPEYPALKHGLEDAIKSLQKEIL